MCAGLVQSLRHFSGCFPVLPSAPLYAACLAAACSGGSPAATAVVQPYVSDCRLRNTPVVAQIDCCGVLYGDGSSCANQFGVASVVDTTYFTTFDGLTYNFAGQADYYLLMDNSGADAFQVQLIRRACGLSTCTMGVAINSTSS